jgi:NAD(P)-dependent dehydrogenase (short-subunit alcohol dehydrogenase family)
MNRFDGKVALVTGASRGIGEAIARRLAAEGATVVAAARTADALEKVVAGIAEAGGKGEALTLDLADPDSVENGVKAVLASHGRIDVLVNGAGLNSATPFLEIGDEELERVVAVDQLAVVRACQEFGRYFVERAVASREGASIINVGSASGLTPLSRVFTYSMTKAAVHNLTRNLAREWGPLGIRCNVLVPGFFPAEQNRAILTPERVDAIMGHTPLARFGEADDLAGPTLLLASDAGRFITGSELVVDGGFSAMTI